MEQVKVALNFGGQRKEKEKEEKQKTKDRKNKGREKGEKGSWSHIAREAPSSVSIGVTMYNL